MARIRSVHPGLFTDEAFVSCTPLARLLSIGLWTEADDYGVFEWKPVTIKMRLLPVDNADVGALLAELEAGNLIRRFSVNGKEYGAVRNFCRYQRPKKPKAHHPIPPEVRTYVGLTASGGEPGDAEAQGGGELGEDESPRSGEPTEVQPPPVPPKSEIAPQMEDGGWRRYTEPNGSGADAPLDRLVFDRGKALLGKSAGGQIVKLRRKFDGDDRRVLHLLDLAATKSNPAEYVGRVIAGDRAATDDEEIAELRARRAAMGPIL
ncbi:MAG TPA: hypothetical protein VD995_04510 [Azospirillum sp.]|nr:hypothetical protein [Azospirillum sp.]